MRALKSSKPSFAGERSIDVALHDWISFAQTLVTAVAMLLLWFWRRSITIALTDQTIQNRLAALDRADTGHDLEIDRLRKWRHEVIVPWQQNLLGDIEERFVTRREWDEARRNNGGSEDSPWPHNRRTKPR